MALYSRRSFPCGGCGGPFRRRKTCGYGLDTATRSRFEKLLGRTPHEEITRVQVQRVKELLAETDLPLAAVAHRAGYKHVEYLSVVFKRETGLPPSEYRRQVRRP